MEHESYTEKIIKETCIADYIREIGQQFVKKYGPDYDITPDLICDIYLGKGDPGPNSEYTFLKSFMDSELDCDKMDYLLRDSLFCGVKLGNFDVERLITSLTVFNQDGCPRLQLIAEEYKLSRNSY